TAEGESHTYGRPSDLGLEQFGVVAQAGAEASRDQEIQDQSHPEQAGRTGEMSSDHQKDRRWEHKARDNVTPAAEVPEPAAKVIGKDLTKAVRRKAVTALSG